MDSKESVFKVPAVPPVKKDLDAAKGMVPKVQSMAPSASSLKKQNVAEQRPIHCVRAINHVTCDSCNEEGDLLNCATCPAAFHLGCCDTPLSKDMTPTGEWICSTCSVKKKKVASTPSAIPAGHPMKVLLEGAATKNNVFELPIKIAHRLPYAGTDNDIVVTTNDIVVTANELVAITNKPVDTIKKPLRTTNKPLGATKKALHKTKKPNSNKTKNKNKSTLEYTRLAHLPANKCSICKKNSKKIALVQCDYCPLLFHLECLNPPLTSLPARKWICPNHVEHHIDLKLASNLSLSARTKIRNKFKGPVKQEAVRLKFLNNPINHRNPSFRHKRKSLSKPRVPIPENVLMHHKSPSIYLPLVKEPVSSSVIDRASACIDEQASNFLSKVAKFAAIVSHQEARLKMNVNAKKESNSSKEPVLQKAGSSQDPVVSTVPQPSTVSGISPMPCVLSLPGSSKSPGTSRLSGTSYATSTTKVLDPKIKSNVIDYLRALKNFAAAKSSTDCKPDFSFNQSQNISVKSVPNIASGSPQIIKIGEDKKASTTTHNPAIIRTCLAPGTFTSPKLIPMNTTTRMVPPGMIPNNVSAITGQAKAPGKIDFSPEAVQRVYQIISANEHTVDDEELLNRMDPELKRLCARQFLNQHFPVMETSEVNKTAIFHAPGPSPNVRARAVLIPLDSLCEPVPMTSKTMVLGLGPVVDVNFNRFGLCKFVSAKHAVIFYDEYSNQYELLNYSCHGTQVDNVYYSSDVNKKSPQSPNVLSTAVSRLYSNSPRLQAQAIYGPTFQTYGGSTSKDNMAHGRKCCCPFKLPDHAPKIDLSGFEGSALLYHGSYIRCGCLQFVFSITEYGNNFKFTKPQTPPPQPLHPRYAAKRPF